MFYLFCLKLLGIHKSINFAVSDEKELAFSEKILGSRVKMKIAGNFPVFFDFAMPTIKEIGEVTLLSIALISPMKNHLLVIEALKKVQGRVLWQIFGPIKDSEYW